MIPTVVHVITDLGLGGAQSLLLDLAARIDPDRSRWTIASLHGVLPDDLREDPRIVDLSKAGRLDPWVPARLARLLARVRPAVLHTHLVHADVLGWMVGARSPRLLRVTTRHYASEGKQETPLYRLSDAATRHADGVIAVSPAVATHLLQRRIAARAKIAIIPNAIDTDLFDPSLHALAPPRSERTVGAVGRLHPQKGFDRLLEAFASLARSRHGLRLEIAGEGSQRPALEKQADRLGIAARVGFLGRIPRAEMPSRYAAWDLVAVPSRWEGFGIAAAEAMAMARPVVASRVEGLADLIVDGRSGILLPPDGPGAWAAALGRLLDDPGRREDLGREARQRILEQYRIETAAEDLLCFYERILSPSAASSR